MQEFALNELKKQGYTEDLDSRRAFERKYRWLVVPGFVLCVGPYPFLRFIWSPFSDSTAQSFALASCFLLGFALCLGAAAHAKRSVPISRRTGAPMRVFLRSDAPADTTEYLYVDHQSRSYFSRVIYRSRT